MSWRLSSRVNLSNERISPADAERQKKTAAAILERLDQQPGLILADEVGMGKTFVALAVAVSVVEATQRRRPVVIMVPPAVREKWPREWDVFRNFCLAPGTEIRATSETITRAVPFLKLLDDPQERRQHILFMTHSALSHSLGDPFVQLAIIQRAMKGRPSLRKQRLAFPRYAGHIIPQFRPFRNADLVDRLLATTPGRWKQVVERETGQPLPDEPVPVPLIRSLGEVNIRPLVEVLSRLPLRESTNLDERLKVVRDEIRSVLRDLWRQYLSIVRIRLPLLIIDEAHHLKNPRVQLSQLLVSTDDEIGALGDVFDRMLFVTATPFQLDHRELIEILRRFEGARWTPELDRAGYRARIEELERRLVQARQAALRLERAWGQLVPEDLKGFEGSAWWRETDRAALPDSLHGASERWIAAHAAIRSVEEALRPWVIRHSRGPREERRDIHAGSAILEVGEAAGRGLTVTGDVTLPFLLAARAQALVAVEGHERRSALRAFFSGGLASSFEAYTETRRRKVTEFADDLEGPVDEPLDRRLEWYLRQLDGVLPQEDHAAWSAHPKIQAVVRKAARLWARGEKVVVFCFYRATGRALRRHLCRAIEDHLIGAARGALGMKDASSEEVRDELDRRAERFFDPDAPVTKLARQSLSQILAREGIDGAERDGVSEIVLRFLRTPSFQVRYFDLTANDTEAALSRAMDNGEPGRLSLADQVRYFAAFLQSRVESERAELLNALHSVQTGSIFAGGAVQDDDEEESGRGPLLPNVRLINGKTRQDARRRLLLAFNTPFFPEILVASSVMAEGVDLHLHCRHVIHHDLDWNPSVLEQRTGRLDRIGCQAERQNQKIVVYEPFLEGTHDEKQFLVVKDRERWFNVVMGGSLEFDEWTADQRADRVPLPPEAANALAMNLALDWKSGG